MGEAIVGKLFGRALIEVDLETIRTVVHEAAPPLRAESARRVCEALHDRASSWHYVGETTGRGKCDDFDSFQFGISSPTRRPTPAAGMDRRIALRASAVRGLSIALGLTPLHPQRPPLAEQVALACCPTPPNH